MRHFGLTGNIASGKSAVASLLAGLGATVIDADVLAREAVAPGTEGFARVVAHFGAEILNADGTIDRTALRRRVFSDAREREALNAIVHPAVGHLRDARLADARARHAEIVVSDIPLLFEVGLEHAFDGIILVDAPAALRLARLVRERRLSEADGQSIMNAQWPSERKRSGATWVIDNDGSREQLAVRVADVWQALRTVPAPAGPTSSPNSSSTPSE